MTLLVPAATVVVLRDGSDGIEALMVRRNADLAFAGGHWVFPGGRVDDADRIGVDEDDLETAARNAAVREANEEAGIRLDADTLVWFSHWTPPPLAPKRFATHFFLAPSPTTGLDVAVDGGEIHDWAWLAPAEALANRDAGTIMLSPPTWITLDHLCSYDTVDAAITTLGAAAPEYFATRISSEGSIPVALYHGDAGYDSGDAAALGPRHRLVMSEDGWRYDRDTLTS